MSRDRQRRTGAKLPVDALAVLVTGVRFLLAFIAAVAVAFLGVRIGDRQGLIAGVVVGFGAPVAFGTLWATYVPESAPRRLERVQRLAIEATGLGAAAVALYLLDTGVVAVGFAAAAVVTLPLRYALASPGVD